MFAMKLSKLIQELQAVMSEHGDLPVVTSMYSDRDFSYTMRLFLSIKESFMRRDTLVELLRCNTNTLGMMKNILLA